MVKRLRSPGSLAVVLCAMTFPAVGAEKKEFGARWKEAEQNVQEGAGEQYFNVVFFKEFFGKYAVHMTKCTQRTGEKMSVELKAAVELGPQGQVLGVMVRPETKTSKCFAALVRRDTFSPPPSAHFWIPVTIAFRER